MSEINNNYSETEDNKIDEIEILDFNDETSVEEVIPQEEASSEESVDPKKEFFSWLVTLGIAIVCVLFLKNFVIINATVPTGSMENTIMPGDNIFGYRLAYMNEGPDRGDVIFFYYPDDETQKFVKRVIGLPGETVVIKDSKIYINYSEEPLDEPYLKEEWTRGTGPFEFQVPEGCYFVLGDNRNTSQDARYWINPYVAEEKIIGKALYIYFPFERMGEVE